MPEPLRIRKSVRKDRTLSQSKTVTPTKIPRPLPDPPSPSRPLPLFPKKATEAPFNSSKKKHSKDVNPKAIRANPRYNATVLSFTSQVNRNTSTISSLITTTKQLQRAHRATKNQRLASFWSFTPTDTNEKDMDMNSRYKGSSLLSDPFLNSGTTDENKQQRIARLRSEGWRTVGLRSKTRGWKGKEYYERFCNQALADLYEDEQIDCADMEQAFL
jgi:hypothetical protein